MLYLRNKHLNEFNVDIAIKGERLMRCEQRRGQVIVCWPYIWWSEV